MNENEKHLNEFLQTKKENYSDIFENSINCKKVGFQTESMGIDLIYATMHILAQKLLISLDYANQSIDKRSLLDVGSQFSFVSFASAFFKVTFIEPRAQHLKFYVPNVCDVTGISGEAQNLPIHDNSFDYVTSFHAIEHFGLGRYGDTLDYFGDQKGIKEFSRVLKPGGFLITGVPTSKKSTIEFNGQRKYFHKDFDKIVEQTGLRKQKGFISYHPGIFDDGTLFAPVESIQDYPEHFTPPVYIAVYKK